MDTNDKFLVTEAHLALDQVRLFLQPIEFDGFH